jgi:hypothetical protein
MLVFACKRAAESDRIDGMTCKEQEEKYGK